MAKLVTLNGLNDDELLNDLFDNEIIVFEDIQGSKIWINWDGVNFTIKPKSISSESIKGFQSFDLGSVLIHKVKFLEYVDPKTNIVSPTIPTAGAQSSSYTLCQGRRNFLETKFQLLISLLHQ